MRGEISVVDSQFVVLNEAGDPAKEHRTTISTRFTSGSLIVCDLDGLEYSGQRLQLGHGEGLWHCRVLLTESRPTTLTPASPTPSSSGPRRTTTEAVKRVAESESDRKCDEDNTESPERQGHADK